MIFSIIFHFTRIRTGLMKRRQKAPTLRVPKLEQT
jgi:hypothetical protein